MAQNAGILTHWYVKDVNLARRSENYLLSPAHSTPEKFENGGFTHQKSSGFEKLRFRNGLVWTVGLIEEIMLRFSNFKCALVATDVFFFLFSREGL